MVCTYRPRRQARRLPRQRSRARRSSIGSRSIVVDDGPDDDTAAVAERHGIRLVRHEENRGLSAARNTGIRAARAPIVAFTDDDCVPAVDWLERLLEAYDVSDDAVGIGGEVTALQRTRLIHRYLADTNRLAPLEIELGTSSSIPYRAWLYLRRNLGGPAARPSARAGVLDRRRQHVVPARRPRRGRRVRRTDPIRGRGRGHLPPAPRRPSRGGCCGSPETPPSPTTSRVTSATPCDAASCTARGARAATSRTRTSNRRCSRCRWRSCCSQRSGSAGQRALAAAALAPLVAFARWPIASVRERRPELLTYPYVQLVEEVAHDIGFVRSWLRLRREYAVGQPADVRATFVEPAAFEPSAPSSAPWADMGVPVA